MVSCHYVGQQLPGSLEDQFLTASHAGDQHLACFDDRFYPNQTTQELKGQVSQLSSREMSKKHQGGFQNKGVLFTYGNRRKCLMGPVLIPFIGCNIF
jgi:hypothetical protein